MVFLRFIFFVGLLNTLVNASDYYFNQTKSPNKANKYLISKIADANISSASVKFGDSKTLVSIEKIPNDKLYEVVFKNLNKEFSLRDFNQIKNMLQLQVFDGSLGEKPDLVKAAQKVKAVLSSTDILSAKSFAEFNLIKSTLVVDLFLYKKSSKAKIQFIGFKEKDVKYLLKIFNEKSEKNNFLDLFTAKNTNFHVDGSVHIVNISSNIKKIIAKFQAWRDNKRKIGFFDIDAKINYTQNNTGELGLFLSCVYGNKYKFNFSGNHTFWDKQLVKIVNTSLLSSLNLNLESVLKQIKDFYKKKGYLDVEVTLEDKTRSEKITKSSTSTSKLNNIDIIINIIEGEKYFLRSYDLLGLENISEQLKSKIEFDIDSAFFNSVINTEFSENSKIAFNKAVLEALFLNGFINAKIIETLNLKSKENRYIDLKLYIRPGLTYKVKSDIYTSKIASLNLPVFIKGQVFTNYNFINTKSKALEIVRDLGYYDAFFRQKKNELLFDEELSTVQIKRNLKLGKKIYLNKVQILGLTKTREKVILREFGNGALKEGEVWTPKRENLLESKLLGLGLFATISLSAIDAFEAIVDGEIATYKNLIVRLSERPSGSIEFGPGFRTDEGILAFLEFNHRNLWQLNRAINFRAGISRKVKDYNFIEQSYSLNMLEPYLKSLPISLRFKTSYEKNDNIITNNSTQVGGFASEEFTGLLNLEHKFNKSFTLNWDLIDFQSPRIFNILPSQSTLFSRRYKVFGTGIGFVLNKKDNLLDPSKGFSLDGYLGYFFPLLGGDKDIHFIKNQFRLNLFSKFIARSTLINSFSYGNIWSLSGGVTTPPTFRFFLGGSTTIRSLSEKSLGSSEDFLTRQQFFLTRTELRIPFYKEIFIAPFFDSGYVDSFAQGSLVNGQAPYWRFGTGLGLKYRTPVGPVSLDFGFNLNPQLLNENKYSIHLSIGNF